MDKKITVIGLPKCLASIGQNITNESDCYTGFYGIETKRVYQISDSSCKHFPSPLDSNKGLFIVKGIFREKLVSGKHLEGVGSLEVVSYKRILGKLYPWEKNDPCLK